MNAHTLHIGTNYVGTSSELAGCHNDARDLYAVCEKNATTSTRLLGIRADRETIVRNVRTILHRLSPGDLAFISFSGHGTQDIDLNHDERSGYDQALVCADFDLIYDDEMAAVIEDRDPKSYVIALLDACHTQTIHRSIGAKRRSIPFNRCRKHRRKLEITYRNPRVLANCGFIAGCEENSYSYDGYFRGRPNGALTYYTIKALRELSSGATFNDLFQKVGGKRPKGYLPSNEYPQQPTRMGSAKNFARKIPFL